ncbi:MAG: hypothetical protein ABL949_03815 [Fimbriimonadaceae bacterium]
MTLLFSIFIHWPRWLETEATLAATWFVWLIVLCRLLYRGDKIDTCAPVKLDFKLTRKAARATLESFQWGCAFGEIFILIMVVLLLFLLLAFTVELILPVLGLVLFLSIGGLLARATNDTHDCQGRLGRSVFWGTIWATLYIGPLLVIVPWLPAVFPKMG